MSVFKISSILHCLDGSVLRPHWTRNYARVETAMRSATEFLVLDGQPGDVIEVFLKINGQQVGTVCMSANGKLDMSWNRDEAQRLRSHKAVATVDQSKRMTALLAAMKPAAQAH